MEPIFQNNKIDRTIWAEGRECLYFSGTSYLGMSASDAFASYVNIGMQQFGLSHGLSRINNVRLKIYQDFELFFAKNAGAENALVFSSGFLAGHAATSFLENEVDAIFIAPDTHPAVLPNSYKKHIYPNAKSWIHACQEFDKNNFGKKLLILANAVDALKPEIHDFSWIEALSGRNEYMLLIDDSHAFGTTGIDIFGTYSKWKKLPVELLISGSLGKGLGIPAGIVLGSEKIIEKLSQQAIFRGASPPPPAYLWAFLNAQTLYQNQHKKLKHNISFFKSIASGLNLQTCDHDFPVFRLFVEDITQRLLNNDIVISSFPYPSPSDPAVHRLVISAWHEEKDLLDLKAALEAAV
ncbi:aminotransferase class I/II-fold pyridoxal phosphate-dependent enzyme [Belliella sp. DSM 107340]|uniref:Aminotransferase class I/II-fold pyridoxal phosphate-dependent enzyme n=1 Tax=Belliella calami TaxID=2923436 RepID=A0ABS9ULE0_9BACT|nr:aminotransferase class I/II-fold pyridoxal phosphate-dependent enzyme [Belliella calami]MCH7397421.1 aminotransferase class I/II-fold pyridoxal phosphate-dependent enzyme [Belliella calami]